MASSNTLDEKREQATMQPDYHAALERARRNQSASKLASEKAARLASEGKFAALCSAALSTPCDGRVALEVNLEGEVRKAVGICPLHRTARCPQHSWQNDQRRHRVLEAIGFPRRYWDPELGRFPPFVADRIHRFATSLPELLDDGIGLLILGPVGAGKTHALSYIAWQAVLQGMAAEGIRYWRADRLLAYLRQHPDDYFAHTPLVMVDDFDAVDLTGYNAELFDGFVEMRYGWQLSLCVTCNSAAIAELPTVKRMVDRWREMMVLLVLDRDSQRTDLTWDVVFSAGVGKTEPPPSRVASGR